MTGKEKAVRVMLCVALAAAVIIPVKGLLIDGVYAWHIRQAEFKNMMLEILALFVVLTAVWLGLKQECGRWLAAGVVCVLFAWCHVVFLPMVMSGLYVGYLWLTGYALRSRLLRDQDKNRWFADFLLGCGSVITVFCLLSALRLGSIPILRGVVLVTGLTASVVCIPDFKKIWKERKGRQTGEKPKRIEAILLAFMVVLVLIQVGRMNISLDFDSLWYGVRSEYILDSGRGIYENMGSVGLVYSYSKGLEVLLLPLSGLASHCYLTFFNVWMAVLTLILVYRIARCYMGRTWGMLAAACAASVPGIMNMSITAKTDSMTLAVQLIMILYFLYYVREKRPSDFAVSTGAFLLSLTLKPTAVVFSTAVYGMSILYIIGARQVKLRAPFRQWAAVVPAFTALVGIWARTMMIVGIPVTSVFSSVFLKLGFHINYPFVSQPLASGGAGSLSMPEYLVRTLGKLLLLPVGEDMNHVVFAWGSSLMCFLILTAVAVALLKSGRASGSERGDAGGEAPERNLLRYAHTVCFPFIAVCLVSLMMLGQIDGNYFMLLYVFIILYGCGAISRCSSVSLRKSILIMLIPVLLLNTTMTAVSNWAWSLGFTPIEVVNKGRFNHKEAKHLRMVETGNEAIWNRLAQNPETRVIAAGTHPEVFNFPCNVQSYDDITSSWGNVRLVKTMDEFIQYLAYAKTDYVYMQAGAVRADSRCFELMGYLVEAGILKDILYEQGNLLARVDLSGEYGEEASKEYEAYLTNYSSVSY